MKTLLEQLGIAFFGLITTVIVVIADIIILRLTRFSLIGTTLYLVVPVGAIVGGGLAASGYYIGARYTHSRANPSLLALMVIIAGLAYFLIYWIDYTYQDRRVRDILTFWEFIQARLTNTQVFIRYLHTGGIGVFGYMFGLFRFVGFLFGGFVVYLILAGEKMCPSCNIYLSSLLTRAKEFADADSAVSYVNALSDVLVGPQTSFNTTDSTALASLAPIPTRVTFNLLGCPICKRQVLEQKVAVHDGGDWKDIDSLARSFEVPAGVDVRSRIE